MIYMQLLGTRSLGAGRVYHTLLTGHTALWQLLGHVEAIRGHGIQRLAFIQRLPGVTRSNYRDIRPRHVGPPHALGSESPHAAFHHQILPIPSYCLNSTCSEPRSRSAIEAYTTPSQTLARYAKALGLRECKVPPCNASFRLVQTALPL